MKKLFSSLWYLSIAIAFAAVAVGAQSPQSTPSGNAPAQAQPAPPPSGQAPDAQGQSQASSTQTFSGTIMKSGDKYVLQDTASGKTYDIDRQDLVQKYEGQKVRIHGTLDPTGKIIQVK